MSAAAFVSRACWPVSRGYLTRGSDRVPRAPERPQNAGSSGPKCPWSTPQVVPGGSRSRRVSNAARTVRLSWGRHNGRLVPPRSARTAGAAMHRPDHRARCPAAPRCRCHAAVMRRRVGAMRGTACAARQAAERAEGPGGRCGIGYDPMRPRPRPMVPVDTASGGRAGRRLVPGLVLVAALAVAACAGGGTPDVSFDPSTACAAATDEGHYRGRVPRARGAPAGKLRGSRPDLGRFGTVVHARDARDARRARHPGGPLRGRHLGPGQRARADRRGVRGAAAGARSG